MKASMLTLKAADDVALGGLFHHRNSWWLKVMIDHGNQRSPSTELAALGLTGTNTGRLRDVTSAKVLTLTTGIEWWPEIAEPAPAPALSVEPVVGALYITSGGPLIWGTWEDPFDNRIIRRCFAVSGADQTLISRGAVDTLPHFPEWMVIAGEANGSAGRALFAVDSAFSSPPSP